MKYLFYRNSDSQAYGLKRKENRYVMAYNTETNRWFAVSPGESVKKKDTEKNHHYGSDYLGENFATKNKIYQSFVKNGDWVQYSRRPRQIKP